jgi:hypothetical protein
VAAEQRTPAAAVRLEASPAVEWVAWVAAVEVAERQAVPVERAVQADVRKRSPLQIPQPCFRRPAFTMGAA